ncbi:MAG: elongation factor P maturation arginine rhamnosyltransferase EarP [Comamonas sp.]|nr:elongation factor P maturation arginine rhamnosyltransferase EarP [Comamonas sp.]
MHAMTATVEPNLLQPATTWDIFCRVIDNYGDIGVCWRLATELAARGLSVNLRIDDASALNWMAPEGFKDVQVLPYDAPYAPHPQVVIEAFGCEAPPLYLAALAQHHGAAQAQTTRLPVLVNLEYLSAEPYVERCHRLPSLIMSGPAKGLTRWFFYPGFTAQTGGLIREQSLPARQASFDSQAWRTAHGLKTTQCAISLFCYEPAALPQFLNQLVTSAANAEWGPQLLVTPGRAAQAVKRQAASHSLQPTYLNPCTQMQFDEMLWACDLNLVRGEDSLVRALWSGRPFVWHIYPQEDNAHHAKLNAFLDWMNAPHSLRQFHHAWNGMAEALSLPVISPQLLQEWRLCVERAQQKLHSHIDLITQLQEFTAEKS